MPGAIIIGILIATGGAHGPGTAALVAALTEALGPGPSIVVEDTVVPSDSDVLRMGEQLHARAVVIVEEQGAPTSVHVRVHVIRDDRWIDRRMTFHTSDTAVERGRAVGLTVGSILLAETTVVAQGGGRGRGAAARGPSGTDGKAGRSEMPQRRQSPSGPRESSDSHHHAVDLSLVGSTGVSGPAGGLGGASHFEFALTEAVWPRFGGGARVGPVAGPGWERCRPLGNSRWRLESDPRPGCRPTGLGRLSGCGNDVSQSIPRHRGWNERASGQGSTGGQSDDSGKGAYRPIVGVVGSGGQRGCVRFNRRVGGDPTGCDDSLGQGIGHGGPPFRVVTRVVVDICLLGLGWRYCLVDGLGLSRPFV